MGRPDVVKFLLEVGADMHALDSSWRSSLDIACALGHMQIVELLKMQTADQAEDVDKDDVGLSVACDIEIDSAKVDVDCIIETITGADDEDVDKDDFVLGVACDIEIDAAKVDVDCIIETSTGADDELEGKNTTLGTEESSLGS